jgi:hypothetical protein
VSPVPSAYLIIGYLAPSIDLFINPFLNLSSFLWNPCHILIKKPTILKKKKKKRELSK